jgi:amidase
VPFGPDAGEGWSGMSTMHAVTRSVRDSALLLDVSEGPDVGDPYWAPPKLRPYLDEVGEDPGTLRIGHLQRTFNGRPTHPDCQQAALEALGAASQAIMGGNLLMVLEQRAEALGRPFGPDDIEGFTYILSEIARKRTASDYALSVRTIHAVGRAMEHFMADFDVLLSPTMGAPPQELGVCSLSNPDIGAMSEAVLTSVGYTQVFNATGQPGMSVPLAWNAAGLPIGIQFIGRFGREDTLLRLAGQLEATKPWAARLPVAVG